MNRKAPLLMLLLTVCACRKSDEAASPPKPHEVKLPPVAVVDAPVELRKMPRLLTLTGSVTADRQSEVAASVAGRIVSTAIERGRRVKAGEMLAIVDSKAASFSAAASAAQAELADTQVAQAQEDCARAEHLYKEGAIALAESNRQKTQCKTQLLQASAARSQAELSAKLAGDTIIRAPFAGAIGERYVSAGEYVQPATRVASIYAFDPVRVTLSVPEPAVGQVQEGQGLDLHVTASPGRAFPATVVYLGPALRSSTRDLLIEAKAPNADGALRPGMFATAELTVGEETLPTVPEDAVIVEGTVKRIFLAREGRAFAMVVRTGVKKDGRIVVLEAFDDKTRVIRHPPPGLGDGASITLGTSPSNQGAAGAPPVQR